MEDQEALRFREAYQKECAEIRNRRSKHFAVSTGGNQECNQVPPENLVGLALSGGGIRSATFCLGVLQGLHKLHLLRIFDYLSTVSGGGYVGGWWSAWLSRDRMVSPVDDNLALLRVEDIKDPVSLVIKLRSKANLDATALFNRFSQKNQDQLLSFDDSQSISYELKLVLTEELNEAIRSHFFYKPPLCELEHDEPISEGYQRIADLKPERYPMLINRLRLEEAFPYEFRDIFPSREKIETQRPRPVFVDVGQKEIEANGDSAIDPIHHLRLYANYLTPRRGILSADTWRAISVILRNLVFTWLILLPVLTSVMLVGQLYFLVLPATRDKFLGGPGALTNTEILTAILWPLVAVLGWIVFLAGLWLICNRDQTSRTDWIIQMICLMAVFALILTGIHVHQPLLTLLEKLLEPRTTPWLLLAWAVVPVASLIYIFRSANGSDLPSGNSEVVARWRHEVRRNKIGTLQSWLLVLFACIGAVLTLSGFSHKVVAFLFEPGDSKSDSISSMNVGRLFGLLPVISAIVGVIFTALKASPAGGSDRRASREPSAVTRFVFAVTPGLVIVVLAVALSAVSYHLIWHLWDLWNGNGPFLKNNERIYTLFFIGGLYGISLCLALALYEMKWRELKPSLSIYALLSLLTINVSWGAHTMAKFIRTESNTDPANGLLLLGFSIFFAFLIGMFVFNRVASGGRWRPFLSANVIGNILGKSNLERHPLTWLLSVMFVLALVGSGVFLSWLSIHEGAAWKIYSSSIPLGLSALGGSIILFRLATRRPQKDNQHKFIIRLFRGKPLLRRPEAIWVLASLCIALPIAIVSWIHALITPRDGTHNLSNLLALSAFPLALALLPTGLIFFRTLIANAYPPESDVPESPRKAVLGGVFSRLFAINAETHHRRRNALRTLVGLCVAASIVGGYWAVRLYRSPVGLVKQLGISVPRGVLLLSLVLTVIVFVFRTAVAKLPSDEGSLAYSPKMPAWRKRLFLSKKFNWLIAAACIGVAFLVGHLNTVWIQHVKEYPNRVGIASIALPGMVAFFSLTIFEIWWGEGGNRRSLWLFSFAYLGLSLLFVVGTLLPGHRWDIYLRPMIIVLGLLVVAFVWIVALGWMVDPNSVAMHQFYKSRLTRAYMGASNMRRREELREITEAVAGDDVPLDSLRNCQRGGPYHLINTTLNLVAGRDLATAQRSASSFVLSSGSCGSSRTNYRSTSEYMNGLLTLGTAIAASGAAVSPSMGSKKPTAALAMLITLLNVRLGYWAPTPNRHNWKMGQPRLWPFYLLREFFSQTNDLSSYCYLTDGGHFDNTGLYSLIERGCRYIVLVDCGADPQPSCFEDLGEAIRRCRIDFGTEIKLDIEPFVEDEDRKPSKYFVTGVIRYSRAHAHSLGWDQSSTVITREDNRWREGVIVYFKPSIIGRETADVRQYASENKSFPHQTTANQWFDEAQFESYRRLGQQYASEAFEGLAAVERLRHTLSIDEIEAMFQELSEVENPSRKPVKLFVGL